MRWVVIAGLLVALAIAALLLWPRTEPVASSRHEFSAQVTPATPVAAQPPTAPAPALAVPDEQRRFEEIRELVRANRIGEARARAREYLEQHPRGTLRAEVENYTGVRLRPSGPDAQ